MRHVRLFLDRAIATLSGIYVVVALAFFGFAFSWWPADTANWLSGIGSIGAAGVALWIATADRHERVKTQQAAGRAQAGLVQVTINPKVGKKFTINVLNYGSRPVLDVAFESAEYRVALSAKAVPDLIHGRCPILDTKVNGASFQFDLDFVSEADSTVITGDKWDDVYSQWDGKGPDPADVIARVRFTDADGTFWRRSSMGTTKMLKR